MSPSGRTALYSRDIGRGRPIIVLHGGPDFDHGYFLPDLDRLADAFRLVYYEQRGRGKSADGVQAQDVTLASDIDDLDQVRQHFQLDSAVLLGHSWGAVLALAYALRHPTRVPGRSRALSSPLQACAHATRRLRDVDGEDEGGIQRTLRIPTLVVSGADDFIPV